MKFLKAPREKIRGVSRDNLFERAKSRDKPDRPVVYSPLFILATRPIKCLTRFLALLQVANVHRVPPFRSAESKRRLILAAVKIPGYERVVIAKQWPEKLVADRRLKRAAQPRHRRGIAVFNDISITRLCTCISFTKEMPVKRANAARSRAPFKREEEMPAAEA